MLCWSAGSSWHYTGSQCLHLQDWWQLILVSLLDHESVGTVIHWNATNYVPIGAAAHPRRMGSVAKPLWATRIQHSSAVLSYLHSSSVKSNLLQFCYLLLLQAFIDLLIFPPSHNMCTCMCACYQVTAG